MNVRTLSRRSGNTKIDQCKPKNTGGKSVPFVSLISKSINLIINDKLVSGEYKTKKAFANISYTERAMSILV